MVLVIVSIPAVSTALMVIGGLIAGVSHGIAFLAGMQTITIASPVDRRAEVAASFFVVAYVAISLPVVGLGLLANTFGLAMAGVIFSALIALLAAAALVGVRHSQSG